MSKSEAQSMYIKEASDPIAPHNFHLYQLTCKKGTATNSTNIWLAITVSGIAVYAEDTLLPTPTSMNINYIGTPRSHYNNNNININIRSHKSRLKSRISFFPWSDIGKLSFEKKKFEIRSTGSQGRKFMYYATSEEISRHLLWFARACHQFYLMVQPKIKEMLKREAEINRKKYRESCISSTSSNNSSSGNSSGNPSSSNNTSKSVSPFDYSSTTSSSTSSSSAGHKKGTSDLDISNSSVCGDSTDILSNSDQRISVISNASSNTTSGIISDKVHCLEDSDRDDIDSDDILVGLTNHRHHHLHHGVNRTITLSGCSPQPVVSLESLALSEPIEHRSCRITEASSKMNLSTNKKHSISISNIMITSTTPTSTSSLTSTAEPVSETFSNIESPSCANQTTVASYNPASEVLITGENCSKVLCLNINEPTNMSDSNCCSVSPYDQMCSDDEDDDEFSYDETDSVFDNTNKSYTSGKSNVTVLSTILKPEAERLLKQGYEADDAELMIDDCINSIELAELKEFEQAEKEKIILNSLINNLPQRTLNSSSDSDSSSDDEDTHHSCYSPLTQEKIHKRRSSPKNSGKQYANNKIACNNALSMNKRTSQKNNKNNNMKQPASSSLSTEVFKEMNIYNNKAQSKPLDHGKNHIYENLKGDDNTNHSPIHKHIQVVTTQKEIHGLPPLMPLRQCPSLNVFPSNYSSPSNPHRTGMRIGVSSLNRPTANRTKHSLLYHQQHRYNNRTPEGAMTNRIYCSRLNDSPSTNLSAGSEPNLYFQSNNSICTSRDLATNKSDSVFDCRLENVPFSTHFVPVTNNHIGDKQTNRHSPNQNSQLTFDQLSHSTHFPIQDFAACLQFHSQDNNNNIEKFYKLQQPHHEMLTVSPITDYHTNGLSPSEMQKKQSPSLKLTSTTTSHKFVNNIIETTNIVY